MFTAFAAKFQLHGTARFGEHRIEGMAVTLLVVVPEDDRQSTVLETMVGRTLYNVVVEDGKGSPLDREAWDTHATEENPRVEDPHRSAFCNPLNPFPST